MAVPLVRLVCVHIAGVRVAEEGSVLVLVIPQLLRCPLTERGHRGAGAGAQLVQDRRVQAAMARGRVIEAGEDGRGATRGKEGVGGQSDTISRKLFIIDRDYDCRIADYI